MNLAREILSLLLTPLFRLVIDRKYESDNHIWFRGLKVWSAQ